MSQFSEDLIASVAAREVTLPLGIVVERRNSIRPGSADIWLPVSFITGAPMDASWSLLVTGQGWERYLAATLLLELNHRDTDAYIFNLMSKVPTLYVVLRQLDDEAEDDGMNGENGKTMPISAHLVTASPSEAEAHLEADDEIVEKVVMPPEIIIWLEAFIERHHVDEPFIKRQKNKISAEHHLFGQEPIFTRRPIGPAKAGKNDQGS